MNLAQFMLLVAVNALVGGTLGQERTVLPLLAGQVFHLDLYTSALTCILALLSGVTADAYGIPAAVGVVAGFTALSGLLVAVRMRGTDHHPAGA